MQVISFWIAHPTQYIQNESRYYFWIFEFSPYSYWSSEGIFSILLQDYAEI